MSVLSYIEYELFDKTFRYMSYQEKRSLMYLISTLLIIVVYCIYVFQLNPDKSLNETTDFKFYGITILLIAPAMIVVNIIAHIVFNIINVIATNKKIPAISDELDQLVELRANRNAYTVFMIGFLLSMATLALEMPPYIMFNTLVGALFAASITWSSSHLYFYRKGF